MKLKLKESFNPRGYTNAIRAINAGIETDEDKEALQKYLQDIIGYCRSIADDYGVLVESDVEIKYDDTYPKDADTIDVENSTNDEIQKWLDRNNDKSEHSDDFNKVWLEVYKELQRRKRDIKDSEATQPEDIAKKEEQSILVKPKFKVGKRIREEE